MERTLERALARLRTRERHPDAETWPTRLLEDACRGSGRDMLN